jgi:3'-phosphoadenosine 5'-phosphosulfate sulfotransferase (PAPS reductase)/FAD synthetase
MHAAPQHIQDLIARGAMFMVNHSGGKDSQAMYLYLRDIVPAAQLIAIHAVLPEVEWDGVEDHIRATLKGTPLLTCKSRRTLLQMIEERGMLPSPSQRQCTSDLKRGPIERTIRQTGHKLIVNCMGMRAQESSSRSKLEPFKLSARNSKAGREWYDWLPIHDWDVSQVFATIASHDQKPHWAYAAGMSRLSCCFCIMSNKADLTTAAKLNPALYAKYVSLEKSTGQVMLMPTKKHGRQTLEEITGIKADLQQPELVEA